MADRADLHVQHLTAAHMDSLPTDLDRILPPRLRESLAVTAAEDDRTARFPWANFDHLRDAGLLGLTVPRRFGGGDAGLRSASELVTEAGRACASTALILAMQLLHHHAIAGNARWPERLAELVGRGAVERGALINTVRVEPALGTPARGGLPETIAHRTPDGWRLEGHKIYATGVSGLTWMIVWARTDEPEPKLGNFLVPVAADGVRVVETWDHLGLRASGSHDVLLEGVTVPADHAVDIRPPEAWRGREPGQAAWNTALIGAVYTGVALAARDWLRGFLHARVPGNLGASLATLPRMQEAMGRIESALLVNRRLIAGLADDADAGRPLDTVQIDLLKTMAADNAVAAVEQAVALCGNHALTRANPLERHLRDVLCARVHTPQADSALLAAGKAALA
jgi:alkylation response protein AidB-like acyl-CoA dehydrogenase